LSFDVAFDDAPLAVVLPPCEATTPTPEVSALFCGAEVCAEFVVEFEFCRDVEAVCCPPHATRSAQATSAEIVVSFRIGEDSCGKNFTGQ
jgi:hypothetical protein